MIRRSFRNKLLALFLLVSFVPVAILGFWSVHSSRQALQSQVEYDLNALLDERVKAIEGYYRGQKTTLDYLAKAEVVIGLTDYLVGAYQAKGSTSEMSTAYINAYLPQLQAISESNDFDDLYLISPSGEVVFSVKQKSDFATNLVDGEFRETELANVFSTSMSMLSTTTSRRLPYAPAANQFVTFMSAPVVEDMRVLGVLAVQLKSDVLLEQFADYTGLGQTGEVMFAERKKNSAVVVAPLRHDPDASLRRMVAIGAETDVPIQLAVRGDSSSGVSVDYRGVKTIAAWRYLPDLNWGVVAKIDSSEAFSLADKQQSQIILFAALSLFAAIVAAVFFSRRVSQPLSAISRATQAMSRGEMNHRLPVKSKDEIGRVASAHNAMLDDLQNMLAQVDRISHGDFETQIEPRSERDTLGIAMQRLTSSLRETAQIASKAAEGDLGSEVNVKGNNDRLGFALAEMVDNLKLRSWQQLGSSRVMEIMREQHGLEAMCDRLIAVLCEFLKAPLGTIYSTGDGKTLILQAHYAVSLGDAPITEISFGEGIVGQVARSRHPMVIDRLPKDYLPIKSSLGSSQPARLVVYPILYAGEVQAVIELGVLEESTDQHLQLFDLLAETLGINIAAAKARDQQQLLLEETLQQSLALQESERALSERQQELQTSNEELTQQAEELRQSQEGLQQQREELRVTNEELEEQKRAIAQQNNALQQAREEAEEKTREVEQASQYKSEFLANMSHELRTPLNSLLILAKSFAENDDGNLNSEQVEAGEIIHASASDLLELINGILDLSKIEAGRMMVHGADVAIVAFADNVQRQFKHVAANKGLTFDIEVSDGIPAKIYSDEVKVGQIIKNLLSNAFKFTSQGSVTVRFSAPDVDSDNAKALTIAVSDTGVGIPEDKQALIFEAFQQADGSTSRSYGGTGLGLSICREMARLLGGEIRVGSEAGVGSTFSLVLPARLPDSENLVELHEPGNEPEVEKPKLRVVSDSTLANPDKPIVPDDREQLSADDDAMLVIEDDPAFAGIVVEMVRSKGFKCIAAHSGNAGVQLARKYQPTGILLDLGLPDMGGAEVIEHLKTGTDTRHIPIHILSGRGIDHELKGAVGVLCKPIRSADLETALGKIEAFARNQLRELLVVEDDPATQTVIRRIVGADNVNITVVQTGAESLELLAENRYDCVILDLGLPDMDGFTLLEKIADSSDIEKPPLIVYSARDLSETDYERLRGYTDSIVVKGAYSDTRLRDEASLFLHSVRKQLDVKQVNPPEVNEHEPTDNTCLCGKTVLLVDDDMRNIYALSRSLKRQQLTVLVAKDGVRALEQLDEHGGDIDIVLMDIMMPEMDGHETTRRIRQQECFRELPVIALTAHAMAEDRERCLEAGASDYMAKPVDIDRLLSMMKVWLCK